MAKRKEAVPRTRAKTAKSVARRTTPTPTFDFDALVPDKEADPAPPTKRILDQALKETRKGARTVVIKGRTRHHCQTQLVPLFSEMAEEAGLTVESRGLGKLQVGKTMVFFPPLVTVERSSRD